MNANDFAWAVLIALGVCIVATCAWSWGGMAYFAWRRRQAEARLKALLAFVGTPEQESEK